MADLQAFTDLLKDISCMTEEFLSLDSPCVDDEGVLHPILEEIINKRDTLATLGDKLPNASAVLKEAVDFQMKSELLGQYMNREFESIQDQIKKRSQAKQFSKSYGGQQQLHSPLFFNDLG
ncbi:hypothetical protein [Brevibacillus nitrificans]|uniref:hypothetical protein n=1 Tax=Brevibacillus nitrificans TaxID=651560 RepID=UPI00261E9297|nr:hypothetical protein [Brevibacillus nitrificans]MED1791095.1 hypothetical protein [Brevibacillus nitrificans]